jgi:hypothetical protein
MCHVNGVVEFPMPNFQNQFSQSVAPTVRHIQEPPGSIRQPSNDRELPPFDVMMSWLSYYHEQTGEWCSPPAVKNDAAEALPEAATLIPFPPRTIRNDKRTSEPVTKNIETVKNTTTSTGFNYVNSIYVARAGEYIEKFAAQSLDTLLAFDCQRTLGLILAWCNFPLFQNSGGRNGRWMTLATATAARELNMRVVTFTACIEELQWAGLITAQSAGSGIISRAELEQLKYDCGRLTESAGKSSPPFWSARSIQSKSTIYILDERLVEEAELPEFQPMLEVSTGTTLHRDTEIPGTEKPDNIRSFPVYMNHESLKHDDDILLKNVTYGREKPGTFTNNFNDEERQKYDFLVKQATFSGFETQGRNSLDSAEAIKFARSSSFTLSDIQSRYNQVVELWENGKCRNPLAMLHWSLTNNRDPRSSEIPTRSRQSRATIHSSQHSNMRKTPLKATRSNPDRFAKLAQTLAKSAASVISADQENKDVSSEKALMLPDLVQTWQEIWNYDLPGRFHLTDEVLRLLVDSTVEYTDDGVGVGGLGNLRLVLSSALEERLLDVATRNVIKIALRQRLGFDFQLSFGVYKSNGK